MNTLQSGEIDVATYIDGSDVASLRSAGFDINIGKSTSFYDISFNPNIAPFQNPKVRVAFNLALNRNAMNQLLNSGYGQALTQPVPAGTPYYDTKLGPLWSYDPSAAKAELAAAGYPNGVNLTCIEIPGIYPADYYSLIIANEEAVGFHVTVDSLGVAQALQAMNVDHTAPCFFIGFGALPDPLLTYQENWAADGEYNAGHYNFGLDQLLAKAAATYNVAQRKTIFDQIAAILKVRPFFAPTATIPTLSAYSKNVSGYVESATGTIDLASIALK